MKIKKNNLIYCMLFIVILTVGNILLILTNGNAMNSLSYLGVFSVLELVAFLWFNTKVNGRFLNFATIFILLLFIFNFGQLLIYTFFRDIYSHVRFLLLLGTNEALYGFKTINVAYGFICLGILISGSKIDRKTLMQNKIDINSRYDWNKIAKTIICVTFPVKLLIDFSCLMVSMTQGGTAARAWLNAFPNVLLYFGKISLIGFAILLVLYKTKPRLQNRVFCFIEIYILVMMVSGIRSENAGYLLVLLFIYLVNRDKKIHLPSLVMYSVLGFFMLTFVVAAGNFRGVGDKSVTSFFNTFIDAFTNKNVIFTLLDTLGDTGYTAQCVINKWLPVYGPSYGTAYTLGWFAVIPNIPGITDLPGKLTAQSYFAIKLQEAGILTSSYTNIGGSLIGELFFNFGIIGGFIASIAVGVMIGWISRKSTKCFETKNYYGLPKYIPMMFFCVYWIRDYFGGGIREYVWGVLFCFIIIKLKDRRNAITEYSIAKRH